ncbi:unnamed protein product, partial [Allacma fusca]
MSSGEAGIDQARTTLAAGTDGVIEIEDIEETVTSIHDTVTTTVEPPPAAPCTGPVVDPTE